MKSGKLAGKHQLWETGCFTLFHFTCRAPVHFAAFAQQTAHEAITVDTTCGVSSPFQATNIIITQLQASGSLSMSSQGAAAAVPSGMSAELGHRLGQISHIMGSLWNAWLLCLLLGRFHGKQMLGCLFLEAATSAVFEMETQQQACSHTLCLVIRWGMNRRDAGKSLA